MRWDRKIQGGRYVVMSVRVVCLVVRFLCAQPRSTQDRSQDVFLVAWLLARIVWSIINSQQASLSSHWANHVQYSTEICVETLYGLLRFSAMGVATERGGVDLLRPRSRGTKERKRIPRTKIMQRWLKNFANVCIPEISDGRTFSLRGDGWGEPAENCLTRTNETPDSRTLYTLVLYLVVTSFSNIYAIPVCTRFSTIGA